MKRITSHVLSSCLAVSAVAQAPPQQPRPEQPAKQDVALEALRLGQRVDGEVTLLDLDGKPQKADDLMGKLTVVNFFSSQSPSQAAWNRRLADMQRDFTRHGVVFLHIDSNATEIGKKPQLAKGKRQPYARVRDYLSKHELPFRVLVDHRNRIADLFAAETTPHVYVFGRHGRLVYKGLVDDDQADRRAGSRNEYLRDVLGKLVEGENIEPFATEPVGSPIKRTGEATLLATHTIVPDDAKQAVAVALAQDKLLLYNFGGFNCASSRIFEQHIFGDATIAPLMKQHLVEARLHTDTQNTLTDEQFASNREAQTRIAGTKAVPYFVVVDPGSGEKLGEFTMTTDWQTLPAKWRTFLDAAAKKAGR